LTDAELRAAGRHRSTLPSTRTPSNSPMDRDRLLRTRASPQNFATAFSDSSRAGQWFNDQGYVGVSSPTYGTLTVFRQNSLTLDAVLDYDPFGASYGFSPIGCLHAADRVASRSSIRLASRVRSASSLRATVTRRS
jgi:hypothetical protein